MGGEHGGEHGVASGTGNRCMAVKHKAHTLGLREGWAAEGYQYC